MYERRVNKKVDVGGEETGSQNDGDDSVLLLSARESEGPIVKTVIILSTTIHTDIYTVTNNGTRHSTMDTPMYSTW